jgi:hypothetical protein
MVHTVPIRDSRGELELVLEFAIDVSEMERLRQELQATQDRMTSLGLMLSSVSHGVKDSHRVGCVYSRNQACARAARIRRRGLDTVEEMVERCAGWFWMCSISPRSVR